MEVPRDLKTPEYLKKKGSTSSLNLIPEATEKEKKTVEKKENINLSGALFIFLVMVFTVALLSYNFYLKVEKNRLEIAVASASQRINFQKTKELKIKNSISKYNAVHDLKKEDLQYFFLINEIEDFDSSINVKSISLDSSNQAVMSGLALSEASFDTFLAALESNKYFEDVNIDQMDILTEEQRNLAAEYNEGQYEISWKVSGKFFKDLTRTEVIEEYQKLQEQ